MSKSTTMGAYLTAARLRRKISIQRAAEDTRIKKEYLMRMESDEFDFLAPAYVRGFLRTYSRFLHVDPEPLLAEFERRYGHTIDASQIVALERRARRVPKEPRRLNKLGLSIVAGTLLIAVFALIGLLSNPDSEDAADSTSTPPPTTAPARTWPPSVPGLVISPSPTPTSSRAPTGDALTKSDLADGIELVVVALEDCWVDVDSDGADVFGETLDAGTSMTFEADSTMEVVLGYPAGVELTLNGHELERIDEVDPIKFLLPRDLDRIG